MSRKRWLALPLLGALPVFAGFCVLGLFAAVSTPNPGLPGLMSYPSAYVGDSFLLPVVAATLVAALGLLDQEPGDHRWGLGGAVCGLTGGLVVVLIWITDDRPTLNWTMPEPHRFNGAGWWHASFLIAVSAYLSALAALTIRRIRTTSRRAPEAVSRILGGPGSALFLSSICSYASLVLCDSLDLSSASAASLGVLAIALVMAVLLVAHSGMMARDAARPLLAALLAVVMSVAPVKSFPIRLTDESIATWVVVLFVCLAGVTLTYLHPRWGVKRPAPDIRWVCMSFLLAGGALGGTWSLGARYEADTSMSKILLVTLVETAVVAICVCLPNGWGALWGARDGTAALIVMLWLAGPYVWTLDRIVENDVLRKAADAVIVGLVVWRLIYPVFTRRFDVQMNAEASARSHRTGPLGREVEQATSAALIFLLAGLIALAGGLVPRAVRDLSLDRASAAATSPTAADYLIVIVGSAAALTSLLTGRQRPLHPGLMSTSRLVMLTGWCTALLLAIDRSSMRAAPWLSIVILIVACASAVWAAESIVGNAFLLQLRRLPWSALPSITLISASSALVVIWIGSRVIAEGDDALSIPSLLVMVTVILTLHGVIVFWSGSAVAPRAPVRTNYSVSANLRQDLLLWLSLIVLACLLPLALIARVSPIDRNREGYASVILAFVPLFAVLVCAFAFAAHNSTHHLKREISRLASDKGAIEGRIGTDRGIARSARLLWRAARSGLDSSQSDRFLRVLAAHLQVQNFLGRLLLTPTVAGIVALVLFNPKPSGVPVIDRDT